MPAVFENATQSFNLTVLAGILIGLAISVYTILLAVEDRRAVMGTIGAIGAKPLGLFGGMLGEGAVVGLLLGGLLGVPSGFLLGTYLVDRFGQSMLAGSGGTIAAHFAPSLIVIGAVAGTVSGILAMIGPALRLAREGPLASMASVGGVQRARTIPMWPLVAGAGALVASVVVLKIFERGSLPLNVGIYGMTVGLCGVVLLTAWIAPRGAGLAIRLLTIARPAAGRLLGADVRHYAVLFALSAALLAQGASSAVRPHRRAIADRADMAEEKSNRLPASLLIAASSACSINRDSQIADATFELVTGAADGRSVTSRWRWTMDLGHCRGWSSASHRERRGAAVYQQGQLVVDEVCRRVAKRGNTGLSEIAASRLGVAAGDWRELPTVTGPRRYQDAGNLSSTDGRQSAGYRRHRAGLRTDFSPRRIQRSSADNGGWLSVRATPTADPRSDFVNLGAGFRYATTTVALARPPTASPDS